MPVIAKYIYDGEDLGHPYIQSTTVLCDFVQFMRQSAETTGYRSSDTPEIQNLRMEATNYSVYAVYLCLLYLHTHTVTSKQLLFSQPFTLTVFLLKISKANLLSEAS